MDTDRLSHINKLSHCTNLEKYLHYRKEKYNFIPTTTPMIQLYRFEHSILLKFATIYGKKIS